MNDWDKDNLRFLMQQNTAEFDAWMLQASDDDIEYAQELIRAAKLEIAMQVAAIMDEVEDVAEAQQVLSKFMLK